MVAGPHGCDTGSYRLDDARPLVPKNGGHAHTLERSIHDVQAGVADTARDHPHLRFAGTRWIQFDVQHSEWCVGLRQDSCSHARASYLLPARTQRPLAYVVASGK
jgi:hypothetical protein